MPVMGRCVPAVVADHNDNDGEGEEVGGEPTLQACFVCVIHSIVQPPEVKGNTSCLCYSGIEDKLFQRAAVAMVTE